MERAEMKNQRGPRKNVTRDKQRNTSWKISRLEEKRDSLKTGSRKMRISASNASGEGRRNCRERIYSKTKAIKPNIKFMMMAERKTVIPVPIMSLPKGGETGSSFSGSS